MTCPKCGYEMETVRYEGIEVDRCKSCLGIWFDNMEHERLKAIHGSEQIDIGNSGLGRAFDKRDRIRCPVCASSMIRMADALQPHIHYESCTTCYGLFFDAGEFRDFKKENTLLDFLRDLIARERR